VQLYHIRFPTFGNERLDFPVCALQDCVEEGCQWRSRNGGGGRDLAIECLVETVLVGRVEGKEEEFERTG
jgi:hypothetical protein